MRNFKTVIAALIIAFCGASATAQAQSCCGSDECKEAQDLGYKPYPYGFIQIQGGMGTTLTDVSCFKLLEPTYSIGGGYMFSPIIGTRLHVNGFKSKGGFDTMNQYYDGITTWNESDGTYDVSGSPIKYKFNYINTNADLMLNVLNIFSQKVKRSFDIYLIGGIGLNYAWHNDEFESITSKYSVGSDISNAWGDKQTPRKSLLSHNLRLGLLADVNVAKNWSIGAEVDFNSLDDRFNSKYKDADDWMLTASLSVTYKFGFKKPCAPAPAPVIIQKEPEPVVVPEKKPEPVVEKPVPVVEEPLKETIFYAIRESDIDKESIMNKVVAWCKKYPNKTISVDGYADKGTGTPKLNIGYAQQRAQKVADKLKSMGVPASQMTVKSYGDTVQPFAENDKNRCVIIEGK
ncbi:MAG: OmpA family protein [Prevotellaceae bacterium]|nr:OmpA family protein [Candidatus Minthosoma caballi]